MTAGAEDLALDPGKVTRIIAGATKRIAPTWPLDRLIAVNPYWGWISQPMSEAAAELGTLTGTRLTMPREWIEHQWADRRLQRRHLAAAASMAFPTCDAAQTHDELVTQLEAALQGRSDPVVSMPLVTDLRDRLEPPRPGTSWTHLVTHQVSQHCAAFFDRFQGSWTMHHSKMLYQSWREQLSADCGLPWRRGLQSLRSRLSTQPSQANALIAVALDAMAIPEAGREAYLSAVLMAIGGWAAWCAYERWQARLYGSDDHLIVELLAIRLHWEWLLFDDASAGELPNDWAAQWAQVRDATQALQEAQQIDWILQHAVEIAYQEHLIEGLSRAVKANAQVSDAPSPAVQAFFCIDVRSEPLRRALEAVSPAVHTSGFAGFFGLPISYSPIGSALTQPQLPGLLAPRHNVSEQTSSVRLDEALVTKRRTALQRVQRWAEFRSMPSSAFSCVETMGLIYGPKLLADSLPRRRQRARWEDIGLSRKTAAALRPHLPLGDADLDAAARMCEGILRAMGLVSGFAPLVMLAGHGSCSVNNPHAASLNCGACGGQTGEVNARVLADLLNTSAIRKRLESAGINIPAATHFVAALHNTLTEEIVLYDLADVPLGSKSAVAQLRGWLDCASERARIERAAGLGLGDKVGHGPALKRALWERANDWAQLRPEWGLADNAAFIAAPRARSKHLNLAGRCFLHDYDHHRDPDLAVLTLIMTAPMVVAHWINMQYHASTVDNRRYGSGNKLLHNVVGGNIGVFEGNGGDLRIGLPIQSLHDGLEPRHTPLRLSVFIEAHRSAIEKVLADHEIVRHLVGNGWLHLFRIDPETSVIEQHHRGAWVAAAIKRRDDF